MLFGVPGAGLYYALCPERNRKLLQRFRPGTAVQSLPLRRRRWRAVREEGAALFGQGGPGGLRLNPKPYFHG